MIDAIATLLASELASVVGRDLETGTFMLQKYLEVALPNAQIANQAGLKNTKLSSVDYRGGRTKTLRNV